MSDCTCLDVFGSAFLTCAGSMATSQLHRSIGKQQSSNSCHAVSMIPTQREKGVGVSYQPCALRVRRAVEVRNRLICSLRHLEVDKAEAAACACLVAHDHGRDNLSSILERLFQRLYSYLYPRKHISLRPVCLCQCTAVHACRLT